MHAETLLLELGQTAGLPQPLRLDEHGCASLMFEGGLKINFENDVDAGILQLYSVLGSIPAQDREGLYRKLLEGNLFGAKTAGATLALDALHNEILLCRSVDLDSIGPAAFVQVVERFVSAVEVWRTQLGEASPAEAAASFPTSPPNHSAASFANAAFLRA